MKKKRYYDADGAPYPGEPFSSVNQLDALIKKLKRLRKKMGNGRVYVTIFSEWPEADITPFPIASENITGCFEVDGDVVLGVGLHMEEMIKEVNTLRRHRNALLDEHIIWVKRVTK